MSSFGWFTTKSQGIAHVWMAEEYDLCDHADGGYCDSRLVRDVQPGDTYCPDCRERLQKVLEQANEES